MNNSRQVFKNGKSLRTGYTTGSCAAAAAKAAASMLYTKEICEQIEIDTPKGWKLKLVVHQPFINEDGAGCYIIKDAGDDPDITDGIEVHVVAKKRCEGGIVVTGGSGIGTVTRQGLSVAPGNPAINPVPMAMILSEVRKVIPPNDSIEIQISIPKGEEIAKKTYNPKLGIIGGLSIIGTSGIVEPMSEEAIKDTIALELQCKKAAGNSHVVLVPGNYGEDFSREKLRIPEKNMVKISNYLGFALEKCLELQFEKILLIGHMGKLVKPAGGIFYTHSRVSDTRMEILTAYLGIMGMETKDLQRIMACKTTEEAMPMIADSGFEAVYDIIAEKCANRCEEYIFNQIDVGVVIFSMKDLLSKSTKTSAILEEILNE